MVKAGIVKERSHKSTGTGRDARRKAGFSARARRWKESTSAPAGNNRAIRQFDFLGRARHVKSRWHFVQIVIQTFGICVGDGPGRYSHDFQNVGFAMPIDTPLIFHAGVKQPAVMNAPTPMIRNLVFIGISYLKIHRLVTRRFPGVP